MKMNKLYIFVSFATMLSWMIVSCEKDDKIPAASYEAGVWFYSNKSMTTFDTLKFDNEFSGTFSFYFSPESEVDTFELAEIRLMGTPVNYDRSVNLVANSGSNAIEGVHFEIIDKILPANAISFVPKILLIKKDLGDEEKVINFELQPSDEFPARVFADTISDDKTFLISLRYTLKFSNLISEPPYWNQCKSFGVWSRVKYEFMIEKLGKYWGVQPVSPSDMNEMINDVYYMRYQLDLWKKEHGDSMRDENGNIIYFS